MKAHIKNRLTKLSERIEVISLAREKDTSKLIISLPSDVDEAGQTTLKAAAAMQYPDKELIVIRTIGSLYPETRRLRENEDFTVHL